MLASEARDVLQRVSKLVPQFEKLLEHRLSAELRDLPSASLDKVQVFQGRCLILQELLNDIRYAAGGTADRTAKPQL